MQKEVIVIGAGFGGLSAAALLAKDGYKVTVLEKNDQPGGRAIVYRDQGFVFDMGPSWYLMPDVFETFFKAFGKEPSEFYDLKRLDPSYRVFYSPDEVVDISPDLEKNKTLFDRYEEDGGEKLEQYLESARYQYKIAMNEFIYKEYKRLYDFFNRKLMVEGSKLHLLESLDRYAKRFISNDKLRKILEYNIVFLGGSPYKSPALYALMSHVDFDLNVWYPPGGMGMIGRGFYKLARSLGVEFHFDHNVTEIEVENGVFRAAITDQGRFEGGIGVVNADYHFAEKHLLDEEYRSFSAKYWRKRKIAPSALLVFLGLDKRIDALEHHNLYFDPNWDEHFETIFKRPAWPENPSYYVCCPSKTDPTVAPEGCENLFILVPVAPGLEDTDEIRDALYEKIITHLEGLVGTSIRDAIVSKRLFAHRDFAHKYNAYRGTALGLAHTLRQTAIFRLPHKSKEVEGLWYTGHYNHPGIGVPMVIISSHILAKEFREYYAE